MQIIDYKNKKLISLGTSDNYSRYSHLADMGVKFFTSQGKLFALIEKNDIRSINELEYLNQQA